MEYSYKKLVIVAIMVVVSIGSEPGVEAIGGQTLCGISGDGLMSCKPSVTAGPYPAPPSAACCSALSNADMQCLCSFKNSRLLPSLGIDPTLAMQLPTKCNLPSQLSHC
uniref:Putative lipid-transfer protein DIR1 n=1 Tax=Davidia involucrata TaxID=16924 RepID=A0A5B7BYQ4_DAVIN